MKNHRLKDKCDRIHKDRREHYVPWTELKQMQKYE